MKKFLILTLFISAAIFSASAKPPKINIDKDEELYYFPSYIAYNKKNDLFHIKIHAWVCEPEFDSAARKMITSAAKKHMNLSDDDLENKTFNERFRLFMIDQESRKSISALIGTSYYNIGVTDANGHTEREIVLPSNIFYSIIKYSGNTIPEEAEVSFTSEAKSDDRIFEGKAKLIKPEGIMVITDIDDTIKISEVYDKSKLLRNVFVNEYKPVPKMQKLLNSWKNKGADFTYLTSSPWQLFPAIQSFITKEKFPEGLIQMKSFGLKDGYLSIFESPEKFKTPIILRIMKDFPDKKFIFIGDSFEKDPEIYADIARKNPGRVPHIFIRNTSAESRDSDRMKKAFDKIDPSSWSLFSDPSEIENLSDNLFR